MAIQRILALISGKLQEYVAKDTSAGAGDAGNIVALNSAGTVDITMMPSGVSAPTATVLASEALAAGNWVQVYNNAGTQNVRKADGSTAGKEANGFVLAGAASGANAVVYTGGINTAVTGQTPGPVYLGTTAGAGATAGATGAGQTYQQVGIALSPTAVAFEPLPAIVRA